MIVIKKERTQAHGIVGRNRGVVLRALRSDDRGGGLSGGSIGFTHATDGQQENREARPHRHTSYPLFSPCNPIAERQLSVADYYMPDDGYWPGWRLMDSKGCRTHPFGPEKSVTIVRNPEAQARAKP
jgi:hypothetical protein